MILVMLRVMALSLWRDKAGLVLAFVLPPVVFIVFASVFGAGASGKLDIRAGVFNQTASPESRRLLSALDRQLGGRFTAYPDRSALQDAVANGEADAGLIVDGDLGLDPTPLTVLIHPGRRAAGEVLTVQVNDAAAQALPDVMMKRDVMRLRPLLGLSKEQLERLGSTRIAASSAPFVRPQMLSGGDPIMIYYAGAVSILFLMFSSMQGAMSLIDERRTGMRLRLGLSVGGVAPLLGGRMLWLTALGVAQALVLFGVATAVYRIPLLQNFMPWLATAICAAAAAAGIALLMAAACQTREQAQTVSSFVILILAAVGGSMAPRFLMPAALQTLGLATPHAWVIEAYQAVLWRQVIDLKVLEAWSILAGFAIVGFLAALAIESRRKL
jgi:ABC-2 type transport system permease protein